MLKIYTISSCHSSKRAKYWMNLHGIKFEEIDLRATKLKREEFNHLLSLTKQGTEEIFSKRNVVYKKLIKETDINSLSLNDLFFEIQKNQMILKRPLIVSKTKLQIGFNEYDIRKFLPQTERKAEIRNILKEIKEEVS